MGIGWLTGRCQGPGRVGAEPELCGVRRQPPLEKSVRLPAEPTPRFLGPPLPRLFVSGNARVTSSPLSQRKRLLREPCEQETKRVLGQNDNRLAGWLDGRGVEKRGGEAAASLVRGWVARCVASAPDLRKARLALFRSSAPAARNGHLAGDSKGERGEGPGIHALSGHS